MFLYFIYNIIFIWGFVWYKTYEYDNIYNKFNIQIGIILLKQGIHR